MTESRAPYPVRVDAAVDPSVSRGLWLGTYARESGDVFSPRWPAPWIAHGTTGETAARRE